MATSDATGNSAVESDNLDFEGTFTCQGSPSTLKLSENGVEWTIKGKSRTLEWEKIIAAHIGKPQKNSKDFQRDDDVQSFTIYYMFYHGKGSSTNLTGALWKVASTTFTTDSKDEETAQLMVKKIKSNIEQREADRPKSLLILVNPASGKFKGVEIYETLTAPVFALAGVKTEVIVLDKDKRCSDILQEHSLEGIDGIASVGGDGTFCGCFNGLLMRAAKEEQIEVNDPAMKLVKTCRRLAIIPAGTGNMMALLFFGSKDTLTATLFVIQGKRFCGDVVSCHSGVNLLSCGTLSAGIGMMCDMGVQREKLRDNGQTRPTLKIIKPLWNPRDFEAEIQLLKTGGDENNPEDWEEFRGKMVHIDCWMGEFGKAGWFPGYLSVHLHRPSSRWSRVNLLGRYAMRREDAHNLPHITNRNTSVFKITLPQVDAYLQNKSDSSATQDMYAQSQDLAGSVVAIDGEGFALKHHTLQYRLHKNVLQLFGRKDLEPA